MIGYALFLLRIGHVDRVADIERTGLRAVNIERASRAHVKRTPVSSVRGNDLVTCLTSGQPTLNDGVLKIPIHRDCPVDTEITGSYIYIYVVPRDGLTRVVVSPTDMPARVTAFEG